MNFSLQPKTTTTEPGSIPSLSPPPSRDLSTALAADLPELEQGRPKRGGRRLAFVLLLLVAAGVGVVAGVPSVGNQFKSLFAASKLEIITFQVQPIRLAVTVNEKGSLESAKNEDVLCEVEGSTTIISILPEGTKVTKGQKVCELDSAALKDSLNNQKITTEQNKASYNQAKLTREVAETAVVEYEKGVFLQDLDTIRGEIALAESDSLRAVDRLEWSRKMFDKGYVSKSQVMGDESNLQRAKFNFEQAQTKLKVLQDYTKEKTLKELTRRRPEGPVR